MFRRVLTLNMNITPLKFIILAENVICIYRNYSGCNKFVRKLIWIRCIMELILIFSNIITRIDYQNTNMKTDVLYFYLATGNSILFILMSCYYSKKFLKLLTNFEIHYSYFEGDKEYLKKLETKQKLLTTAAVIYSLIKLITFVYSRIQNELDMPGLNLFYVYIFHINLFMCDFRYIFEYFVLYFILYVLSEQLDVVTRSVVKEDNNVLNIRETPNVGEDTTVELTLEYREQLTQFDKWSAAYTNVKESSKLCNSIFGVQLTVMLATILFYYIILLYSMTTMSVTGNFTPIRQCIYFLTLGVFVSALYLLSMSAQRAQNNADILRRKLCLLLIHSLINEPRYKATNDLLRLISTRPIRTEAFGSINVNMSLLPSCVAFFTSYTVIALQFNNVL